MSGGLITSGLVEIYFHHQESWERVALLQQEITTAAAFKIERFIYEIEHDLRATAKSREITERGLTPDYRSELRKLLVIARGVSEAHALDSTGTIGVTVSRLGTVLGTAVPRARPEALEGTRRGASYFGPVYFVEESEPYMTLAVPLERFAGDVIGVLQAEVNLKYVWEVVARLKAGRAGYAYVVARNGDLIAHPEISRVLQRRNVAHLEQFAVAFGPDEKRATGIATQNLDGKSVFASSALVPGLDWAVLVEQPVGEVYGPLYASMLRTSGLLLVGLGLALLAGVLVARRVVRPLEELKQGVERIGHGDLGFRVEVKTRDEIGTLAEAFNSMTAALQEAHVGLERKIEERTQALRIANQQLDEASRHKSQFLANASHELRTPMNAIIGFSEVLLDPALPMTDQERRQFLGDILQSGKHLLALINDLLDLSKIEAGRMELQTQPASLHAVIEAVHSTVRPLAAVKTIDVHVETDEALGSLEMDPVRIRQVLLNLLGNALKFTPDGGTVWLRAARRAGVVVVEVEDTGPGIRSEDHERIFLEFHQATLETAERPQGTGLGLALAKKFVEMHGGYLWLESGVGKGSRFLFTLPVS